jgi:methylthioribose-1-phosphate isomerase
VLTPEQIIRLEDDRVVLLDQRRLPDEIPIEERDPAEITVRFSARNPAFDVTPADLISAIMTEVGVHRTPYERLARPVVA